MLPDDPASALEWRLLDCFFDQYVMNAAPAVVGEALRPTPDRLQEAKESAAKALETAYGWLQSWLDGRERASGTGFSMADCAAAPSLFYGDRVHRSATNIPTYELIAPAFRPGPRLRERWKSTAPTSPAAPRIEIRRRAALPMSESWTGVNFYSWRQPDGS